MKIVILTKSSKHKNYCVAGVNIETGEKIRLVSQDDSTSGALTKEDITYSNGEMLQKLDLIEANNLQEYADIIQKENYLIDRKESFIKLDEMNVDYIINFLDNNKYIFENNCETISEYELNKINYSIQINKVQDVRIYIIRNSLNQKKTKIDFTYKEIRCNRWSVTDQDYYNYEIGDVIKYSEAIIVTSVGQSDSIDHMKYVSAIYPL